MYKIGAEIFFVRGWKVYRGYVESIDETYRLYKVIPTEESVARKVEFMLVPFENVVRLIEEG